MSELKPCPFCGSRNVAQGASADRISVWCFCGARGPDVPFPENCDPVPPIQKCYEAWNHRASLPEPVQVGVKPLVWEDREEKRLGGVTEKFWRAQTAFDWGYRIRLVAGQYEVHGMPGEHVTLGTAQVAAQADYEQRIRSALFSAPPANFEQAVEILDIIKKWEDWAFEWSGSAFIADEPSKEISDSECKSALYSDLCSLGNHMVWLHEKLSALPMLGAGQEKEAKAVGYARAVDVELEGRPFEGRTSFWCSERQNAYCSVPVYIHPAPASPASIPGAASAQNPLEWAVERWNAEVKNRPLKNIHRRALDTAWRQVIRHFGGDADACVGPSHDDLVAEHPEEFREERAASPAVVEITEEMVERAARAILEARYPGTRAEDIWLDPAVVKDARAALEAASLASCRQVATHRHRKSGGEYTLLGIGKIQSEMWEERGEGTIDLPAPLTSVDMREVAIYRSCADGSLWARPREEFEDGRFDALSADLPGER